MKNIYHRLLLLIAGATQKELASQVRYLKIENEILRSKLPSRVDVRAQERNTLVKFGSNLDKSLTELATIVHPYTLRRWIRESLIDLALALHSSALHPSREGSVREPQHPIGRQEH